MVSERIQPLLPVRGSAESIVFSRLQHGFLVESYSTSRFGQVRRKRQIRHVGLRSPCTITTPKTVEVAANASSAAKNIYFPPHEYYPAQCTSECDADHKRLLPDPRRAVLGDNRFNGACLPAFAALEIDCGRSIVIRGVIGDGGIAVEGRTDQARVDPRPCISVWTAIDVVSGNVTRRRTFPVQIDDVLSGGLDDDLIRFFRDKPATPCCLHDEGVGGCSGRLSAEMQRGRRAGHLSRDSHRQLSRGDLPLVRSAAASRLDDFRVGSFDRSVRQAGGSDGDAGRHTRGNQ